VNFLNFEAYRYCFSRAIVDLVAISSGVGRLSVTIRSSLRATVTHGLRAVNVRWRGASTRRTTSVIHAARSTTLGRAIRWAKGMGGRRVVIKFTSTALFWNEAPVALRAIVAERSAPLWDVAGLSGVGAGAATATGAGNTADDVVLGAMV